MPHRANYFVTTMVYIHNTLYFTISLGFSISYCYITCLACHIAVNNLLLFSTSEVGYQYNTRHAANNIVMRVLFE